MDKDIVQTSARFGSVASYLGRAVYGEGNFYVRPNVERHRWEIHKGQRPERIEDIPETPTLSVEPMYDNNIGKRCMIESHNGVALTKKLLKGAAKLKD